MEGPPTSEMAQQPDSDTSASGECVPLRGSERLATLVDDGSMKVIHAMALHSSSPSAISAFLQYVPQALVLTFNRHPRMRALQVKGEVAMAEIQPQITLDSVAKKKLLEL